MPKFARVTVARTTVAIAVALLAFACATGVGFEGDELQGGTRDAGGRPGDATSQSDGAVPESDGAPYVPGDAATANEDADARSPVAIGPTVSCGGYDYPQSVTVAPSSCAGTLSGCTGAHEFRVAGCFTSTPTGNPCPAGFNVAANMLIGIWAQAASITRELSSDPGMVCMYTGSTASEGTPLASACGFSLPKAAYCWKRGDGCNCPDLPACATTCCYQACHQTVPVCSTSSYQAPVLCVR